MDTHQSVFLAPVRVCHAGEDLDWLGYKCCCTAVDLVTEVTLVTTGDGHSSIFFDAVWRLLSDRFNLAVERPKIEVFNKAPVGSGLSTSSSLIIALIQACLAHAGLNWISSDELANIAYEVEFQITRGGGMDQLTIVHGGTLLLQGKSVGLPIILDKASWPTDFVLIIIDSGERKETTPHIKIVREQLRVSDVRLREYIIEIDACANIAFETIENGDLRGLQGVLNRAHHAMRDLQEMSTEKLELIRDLALSVGCAGVKLTGAGNGGCLFSIVQRDERMHLAENLRLAYESYGLEVRVLTPEVSETGLSMPSKNDIR